MGTLTSQLKKKKELQQLAFYVVKGLFSIFW